MYAFRWCVSPRPSLPLVCPCRSDQYRSQWRFQDRSARGDESIMKASTSSTQAVTLLVSFTGAVPGIAVTPVSGTSTGIIVGGIIAAILGSAGILAAVVYFLRKCRGRQDEAFSEEIWNRSDARRQSAALGADAEPVRPYGAPLRPPSMIECHLNSTPSMPPRQPTLPNVYPNNAYASGNGYAADSYGSVPVVHQNSVTGGPFSPVVSSPDAADPHYTGLSRSGVAPFQAAQYAEITEKLGGPMSSVLGAVSEERQAAVSDNMAAPSYDDPSTQGVNMHTESPFVDAPVVQQPIGNPSYESDDELPLPSECIQSDAYPITSTDLPEIHVPERSFSPVASLEFPVPLSVRSSPSTISAEFSDLRGPPPSEPNHKSSPLATSTPMRAQEQPTVIPREPKTYDEEDAPTVDSEHQSCLHITIRYVRSTRRLAVLFGAFDTACITDLLFYSVPRSQRLSPSLSRGGGCTS
ncbi:hypothetical protein EDB84DRAFT_1678901 [Lactarius hengduanensis]|nr:hypothetical protein EDB84DRAFT_1678901 [Lactarius hengduanensis]